MWPINSRTHNNQYRRCPQYRSIIYETGRKTELCKLPQYWILHLPNTKHRYSLPKDPSKHAIEIFFFFFWRNIEINPEDYESRWFVEYCVHDYWGVSFQCAKINAHPWSDRSPVRCRLKHLWISLWSWIKSHNMAGGLIIDDFNNDHYMDIVCSEWERLLQCTTSSMIKGKIIDMSKGSQGWEIARRFKYDPFRLWQWRR